jgi:hypothetical protein
MVTQITRTFGVGLPLLSRRYGDVATPPRAIFDHEVKNSVPWQPPCEQDAEEEDLD